MPPSICDTHASDCIVDVHDMILFTLSNLWNVLIWKSLFTCVFGAGEPYLHSPNIVTSSHMQGNVRRSRWLQVGNIPRITRFGQEPLLAKPPRMQCLVAWPTTAPYTKLCSIPIIMNGQQSYKDSQHVGVLASGGFTVSQITRPM